MEFHNINTVGEIKIEWLTSLPTRTSNDVGRIAFITGENKYD